MMNLVGAVGARVPRRDDSLEHRVTNIVEEPALAVAVRNVDDCRNSKFTKSRHYAADVRSAMTDDGFRGSCAWPALEAQVF